MPTSFHDKVTLRGFHFEDFSLTFNLNAAIVAADVGKAVSIDTSGNNKVKLVAAGEYVIGRLASFENRLVEGSRVGAVEIRFANLLPIGGTVTLGQSVMGGTTAGTVQASTTNDPDSNFVAEIIGTDAVVVKC